MIARWVEHHLVDDNVLVPCRVVSTPLGMLDDSEPLAAAVRVRLQRAFAVWPAEQLRLQHRITISQVDRHLARRLEVHRDNFPATARCLTKKRCAVGKITPSGHRQAVQIHSTFAAVVKFHPVDGTLAGKVHLVQAKRLAKRRTAHVRRARRGIGKQKPLGAPARLAANRATVQRHVGPDCRHHGHAVRLRQINRHRRLDAESGDCK